MGSRMTVQKVVIEGGVRKNVIGGDTERCN
jgi:hypothetical protein